MFMRILVVEDEHRIANSIKQGLEQERYAVNLAYNGNDGFDLASSEEHDLIILDLMLPGLSGLEIVKRLRKEENVHTPILILTAKSGVEDKVAGLNSGADDYLSKPFAFAELLARIKALTRRPKETLRTTLKVGDLSLDTLSYQVQRANKSIKLSKREFALLEYLIINSDTILTKGNIINHVWNYDADILPNTVEVYVGYLRNKIDKSFPDKKALIKTVRGFGYVISAKK